MKRDLRKAEEEEKWRENANNRDRWKQITKVAVLRSDQYISINPTQGKQEEEQQQPLNPFRCFQYVKTVSLNYVVCLCYVRHPASVTFLVMKLLYFCNDYDLKESCISIIAIGYVGDTYCVVCLGNA